MSKFDSSVYEELCDEKRADRDAYSERRTSASRRRRVGKKVTPVPSGMYKRRNKHWSW
jgi:hypothetical protein